MFARWTCAIMAAVVSLTAFAEEPTTGPYVDAGGPAFEVKDRDVPLREGHKYRVVFEATEYPGEMTEVNRELTIVGPETRTGYVHGGRCYPARRHDERKRSQYNKQPATFFHGCSSFCKAIDTGFGTRTY